MKQIKKSYKVRKYGSSIIILFDKFDREVLKIRPGKIVTITIESID